MDGDPELQAQRLRLARERWAANDVAGVVAELGPLPDEDLLAEPELGFLLANACRRLGDPVRARQLVAALADVCARRGLDALESRRRNLAAALEFDRGDLAAAAAGWEQVVEAASRAGDEATLTKAWTNLGVVHTLRAAWPEALACHGRALAQAHRMGDRRVAAEAHQNIALAYRELGFTREADAHFLSALDGAQRSDADDIAGRVEAERGLAFLLAGDDRFAEAAAARALTRFLRVRDVTGTGEAERVLGLVALARGDIAGAAERMQRARRAGESGGALLLVAEADIALALIGAQAGADGMVALAAIGASGWAERTAERVRMLAARNRPTGSA